MGRRSAHLRPDGDAGPRVLEGARVLVTRSPERAGALVSALRETGAEPLLLPLIDFERASDQHSLDVAFDALGAGAYSWLVISSVTTVQVLQGMAADRGAALSAWLPGNLQVAAIGPSTRRALEGLDIAVDLAPAGQQSGAGLLDIWPEGPGSVLLPQADIADPRLRRGLAARGAWVQAVTAYRTVDYPADPDRSLAGLFPPDEHGAPVLTPADAKVALDAGELHAIVAASPSAARRVCSALAPLGPCRLVAIGRSTEAEARGLGLVVAAVADEPTPSGLVAAVIEALDPGHPHSTPPTRRL
ncbi:uroporphyrinogen-III synthase [Arthrobacter sp. B3I4]|uniref:uroporphyrinogen-III synthase n=1 Tax=Arthrobacter sp. B3I4 TaxID=3042267 RepID=UPI002789E5C5|nr:uroporphyrinogen-III synthase [Arthrobacter sp. B3I4]MDQ0755690.1 uroporphyrinogen-III synthase [Arthrobacter sp. B3I4]